MHDQGIELRARVGTGTLLRNKNKNMAISFFSDLSGNVEIAELVVRS